jgi:hypothetical protein
MRALKNNPASRKDREFNLEITRLKDEGLEDPNSLPEPETPVGDAIAEPNVYIAELQGILTLIDAEEGE